MSVFVRNTIVLLACTLAPAALAEDGLDARARQLAALRAEVASLSDEIAARRDEADARLSAFQAQQIDLDVQIQREELRVRQLEDLLASRRSAEVADADLEAAARPLVADAIASTRQVVAAGLPFRLEERLAALDEIARGLEGGELVPTRALGRLWAFLEDERRLSRENALDRQTLSLGGREVLAEVARLGNVAMFYRTPDGEVGWAARGSDGWTWVASTGDQVAQVNLLFESLAKGIRTGWFELPWAFGDVTPPEDR